MLVGLALPQAFFRWYLREAADHIERAHILRTTLAVRIAASLAGFALVLLAAVPLTAVLYGGENLLVFALVAPIVLFDSFNGIPLSFLRAERRPRDYVAISLTRAITGTVLIVAARRRLGIRGRRRRARVGDRSGTQRRHRCVGPLARRHLAAGPRPGPFPRDAGVRAPAGPGRGGGMDAQPRRPPAAAGDHGQQGPGRRVHPRVHRRTRHQRARHPAVQPRVGRDVLGDLAVGRRPANLRPHVDLVPGHRLRGGAVPERHPRPT